MSQLKGPRYTRAIVTAFTLILLLTACGRSTTPVAEPVQPAARAPEPAPPPPVARPEPVMEQSSGPVLNPRHPDRYVVVRGDTLWDISAMFLRDPWLWPEIWHVNPQVANPHLIYPGDVLVLSYVNGRPRVTLGSVNRLSPRIRREALDEAIRTIPYDAIGPFLAKPTVLTKAQAADLPYILSTKGHLVAGAGFDVYVRGLDGDGTDYRVLHIGKPLIDPETNDLLGYNAIYVGEGQVKRGGDPATVFLRRTQREALEGDRLIPAPVEPNLNFLPRPPPSQVQGQIISIVDGVARVGRYQIVVLNRGASHGLEPGSVLAVYQRGDVVRDRFAKRGGGILGGEKVQLPEEHAGELMVFRTFERMSYALIMRATSEIRNYDIVRNP